MEQVLTITILSYFQTVFNVSIDTSNAIEVISKLKEFEEIHLNNKANFKAFRGLSFESILEVIHQDIHRIEQSHSFYESKGNLMTPYTKQGNIERKNKEYTNIDTDIIVDKLHLKIINSASNIINDTKTGKRLTPRQVINANRAKKTLKRNNNQ